MPTKSAQHLVPTAELAPSEINYHTRPKLTTTLASNDYNIVPGQSSNT
ncbi:hypothetical protein CCACVL1_27683 [Corchorus capsularis]|uniref:Uncharacterized protein n=1 Tax=Corchorus capsularis TaxID=210143 RepID=A0A1R3G994_COCAP|nr:hypothetical protein CCACVL1_27683 [Corchorus capsularis]